MNNTVAKIITVLGYVEIFSGLFLGIIFGTSTHTDEFGSSVSTFHFQVALIWWVSGIVTGMLFIGFSEVIKLLSDIKDKLYNENSIKSQENSNIPETNVENTSTLGIFELSKEYTKEIPKSKKKVIETYLKSNKVDFDELYATPFNHYVIIKSDNEHKIVYVVGYKPAILTEDDWTKEMKDWYASEYKGN